MVICMDTCMEEKQIPLTKASFWSGICRCTCYTSGDSTFLPRLLISNINHIFWGGPLWKDSILYRFCNKSKSACEWDTPFSFHILAWNHHHTNRTYFPLSLYYTFWNRSDFKYFKLKRNIKQHQFIPKKVQASFTSFLFFYLFLALSSFLFRLRFLFFLLFSFFVLSRFLFTISSFPFLLFNFDSNFGQYRSLSINNTFKF